MKQASFSSEKFLTMENQNNAAFHPGHILPLFRNVILKTRKGIDI